MMTIDELYRNLINRGYRVCGSEQLTVGATAVSLSSVPTSAVGAICIVESTVTDSAEIVVRYLETGSDPTSSVGMPCNHMTVFSIASASDLYKFRAIRGQA